MFTGIIEETGRLTRISGDSQAARLGIGCKKVLEHTKIGDSIAVNGICLTVVSMTEQGFEADVMEETLKRSSLGALKTGDTVNLERAMAADGRFGGHIVSGHIDGTGRVERMEQRANAVWITIQAQRALMRYIVEKGSIALDGVSLTVASVSEGSFQVSMIPHTIQETIWNQKKEGSLVNIECDVIGKYVEKLLSPALEEEKKQESKITEAFLKKYGF